MQYSQLSERAISEIIKAHFKNQSPDEIHSVDFEIGLQLFTEAEEYRPVFKGAKVYFKDKPNDSDK